ncbi:Glutathione S-transferase [Orchesella cincta]|uniref:glutathione transferase n=1 Tax=Orchesella cincta TaxID=48709 RepID=A0A1D2N6L6_ORCCI|nr:Glutathione S-transferase [Orchesella cincta]
MSSYKLHYFDSRGVSEPIRLLFAYANVKYEDVRFTRGPQWTEIKPKMPWNVVPVLEVDGEKISQSRAILRFLGRKFGLAPADELQLAKCDEYIDAIIDLRTEGKAFYREQDPQKRQALHDEFIADKYFQYMKKFKDILRKNGTGYLVGNKLSYADIFIAYTVEQISSWVVCKDWRDGSYEEVKTHMKMVMGLPGIKEWVESRPKTKT